MRCLGGRFGGARAATWVGWAFGLGYFGLALHWIVEPFLIDAARHAWMAPFALVLLAGGLALFWAAGFAAARWVAGRNAARFALAWPAAMALAEFARGHVLTGFPWALPGYLWLDTPVAQAATWVGPYGLTLLTFVFGALAAHAVTRRRAIIVAAAATLAVAAAWALPEPPPAADTTTTVRLVQPNVAQRDKWDPALVDRHFQRLLAATAKGPVPDLVVWPETSVAWALERAGPVPETIAAAGRGAPVALGVQRFDGPGAFNSLAVVAPGGTVTSVYDKHHLVPFGEYIPWGSASRWLGLRSFAAQDGFGFAAGPGPRLLPLAGRALPLICYEAIFPGHVMHEPRPDWILQVTNDAWFGTFAGPQQHLAQARFRAIEQGLPLMRAANTGISAAIDPWGRVTESLGLGVAGHLDVPLPAPIPPPLYARTGDLPAVAAALLLLLGTGLRTRRKGPGNAD